LCNEHVLEHLDLCQQFAPQITEQIVIQPIHLRHLFACPPCELLWAGPAFRLFSKVTRRQAKP